MENALAKKIDLTMEEVKKYICPEATEQEAYFFLKLCEAQGLNPFLREAYLIKYGTEKATIVTGKDTFTKRADRLPQYDGFKAGIVILSNKQVIYREGSFTVEGETLLGGWAEVFRKDRVNPFRNEVSLTEYARYKKDGTLMSNWKTMPATMIRKVALVQSLREAFPDEFGGIYSPEEMPIDVSAMPTYTKGEAPKIPAPQEIKPPIQELQKKNGKSQPSSDNPPIVTTRIKDVTTTSGKKQDDTPWMLYVILTENDEKFSTFSKSMGEAARKFKLNNTPCTITYETTEKGNNLKEIVEDIQDANAQT